ncbi:methyl-accepting chemotaxis protein [Ideonella sp. DXS29W]|uniref:Methyl-accepting chemotaxis protein n=1 Tax=Ideonella lacteola TaxID=2984193 RepID=A0ABU9BWW8_9BURK
MFKISMGLKGQLLSLALSGLAAAAAISTIAYVNIQRLADAEADVSEDAIPSLLIIGKINDVASNVREKQLKLTLARSPEQIQTDEADMRRYIEAAGPLFTDYEQRIDSDQERKLEETVRRRFDEFVKHAESTRLAMSSSDASAAESARASAHDADSKLFDELGAAIDELSSFNEEAVKQTHADAVSTASRATWVLIAAALTSAIVLIGVALSVIGRLIRQIGGEPQQAADLAKAVALGDLSTAVTIRPGDADSVMAHLAQMQAGLAGIVHSVRTNADGLANASSEIAQANSDLSRRTEQQASALEETAASMEELGSTVKQNADNARQANQLALGAREVATQGGEVVGQVVDTMRGINESSKKIVDIIGVIDGIAFQTNILALNAAVEAARAGEQGRGFAVVAGEVRTLAQRSADAAREVKTLISTSVERVEAGTALVDRAGSTMAEVVSSIKRVTDIMGEISSASVEQSAGVKQVGEAVTQMDQATQQNAALVEQSAATSEALKVQAEELVQAVAVFKIAHASV